MTEYEPIEIANHRRAWIDALRSGEYPQAQNKLEDGGAYCCLGVACEVALKSGLAIEKWVGPSGQTVYGVREGGAHSCTSLPPAVSEWLGLDHAESWGAAWTGAGELSVLNDNDRWDFEHIAAAIESGLYARNPNG